jgi:4-alpha-glucanotransferase
MALSAHACDTTLISLAWLVDHHLLPATGDVTDATVHCQYLKMAHANFTAATAQEFAQSYRQFCEQHADWLDDYALFMTLRDVHQQQPWMQWRKPLRDRAPDALAQTKAQHASLIDYYKFSQFIFFTQWHELKAYAQQHKLLLFGDMPIYVALDSADVWAHRDLFALTADGKPETVAGVPPDYFSATGQRWGNPHYRWKTMQTDHFLWWQNRMRTQLELFDLVRIDHFRGLSAYWEIPAQADSAIHGRWVKAPGKALLKSLSATFAELPLVAEDLGLITEDVHELRREFSLPGMKILQFAFDGNPANIYLPHHHEFNAVVYTGTHDNDTTLSWFQQLPVTTREYVYRYLNVTVSDTTLATMPWLLIQAALASVCCLAVLPMQDILSLGEGHRMNTPGTTLGNWRWRFSWSQIEPTVTQRLRGLMHLYDRVATI